MSADRPQPLMDEHPQGDTTVADVDIYEQSAWATWLTREADEDNWPNDDEPVADDGAHLLQLVSAVRHLRRGLRPGFTVWDALEEALRWRITEQLTAADGAPHPEQADADPNDLDPLRTQLHHLVDLTGTSDQPSADTLLLQSIRRWSASMANAYNRGHAWPTYDPLG